MKTMFICIATLIAMGCSNYNEVEGVNPAAPTKIFHASIDEEVSRVYMATDLSMHWNAADAISLFCSAKNEKYQFQGKDGDINGDFAPVQEGNTTATMSHYAALYPYMSAATISEDGSTLHVTMPAVQNYATASMGKDANMMTAATASLERRDLKFRNVCGYLCLNLYGNDVTLGSVVLKGNGSEKLAGEATVSVTYDAPSVVTMGDAATDAVTLLCDNVSLGSSTEPTQLYFAIPPTTFEQGFTVTVTDAGGKVFVVDTDKRVAIERNTIQPMAAVEVTPKEATIEGLTAPEMVSLPAQSAKAQNVSVGCSTEDVTISASEPWFGVVGGTATVAKGDAQSVALWSEPNFSTAERSAVITITGVRSGLSVQLPVVQSPYFTTIQESLPARLETQSSSYDNSRWVSDGVCSPKGSAAVLCAVSPSGRTLTYTTSTGPGVANLAKGDYLLYAVPTKGVAAGEQIDFMCTIAALAENSPKYWIFEYWDNGKWNSVESSLRTAAEDASIRYSLYCKLLTSAHNTTFTQSFTLSQPVEQGCVKVRLRALSSGDGGVRIPSASGYMGMYMINYPNATPITDTKRVLFVGNSFTYYYGTAFMFKEIARTQGHQVDAVISVKGGQEFAEHLNLELSCDAIRQGNYDYAILQDTSPNPAIYADQGTASILEACKQINALTLTYSPSCQIVYERTWACPYDNYRGYGSYDKLDYLLKKGTEMLQQELSEDVWVSPIGLGFRLGREQNLELLYTDNRHQSRVGAYMKACINYLFVYKSRFTSAVSDCAVDATVAQKVRDIAERVVFEDVEEVYDFDTPTTTIDAANCYIIDKAGEYSIRADVMGNGNIPEGSAITSYELAGKGAKVLWSSYNTTTAPASDAELISNVALNNGFITFTAGANGFKEGNVVIALYDDAACTGNILWSWHIWLCEDVKEQSYNGQVWLDRNLGALTAEAGNPLTLGLLYQFGRKDPFRGAAAINSNTVAATTGSWPEVTTTIPSSPEAYAIANPMQLIANDGSSKDWFASSTASQNHALWNSQGKTMYDPCPKGYRVPERYAWNVGLTSETAFFTKTNFPYDSTTYCRTYTDGDMVVVYPIAGCTSAAGAYTNVGVKGYYRTASQGSTAKYADILELTTSAVDTSSANYRSSGYSVRCVKE